MLRTVFRILFRLKVVGDAAQFNAGKLLVIANHRSPLDGALLGIFLPGSPVVALSREDIQGGFIRWVMAKIPHLTLEISNPLAVKRLIKLLESGHTVVLFPEGRINRTAGPMKMYEAPAFIAAKSGAAIVPVHIDGTGAEPFGRAGSRSPKKWFPRVKLTIQPAVRLTALQTGSARQRRRAEAMELRRMMQEMVFRARPSQTLFQAFLDAVALYGRGAGIVEDTRGVKQSYGQLLKMSLAFGRWACRFSAEKEKVGVLLPNLSTTLSVVLGLSAMGRIPAMLNYTSGISGMQSACVAASVKSVITSRKFLESTKLDLEGKFLGGARLLFLEDFHDEFSLPDRLWLLGFALWRPRRVMHRVRRDDPALVLFTSGSEDRPKGVALSHSAVLSNIAQIKAVIDVSPDDRFLNSLPMYHAYSLTCSTLLPLLSGAWQFLYPNPLHYRIIPEIAYRKDCTWVFGTGTFLGHYARHAHPYDFYRVRYVLSGAEKLNQQAARIWSDEFGLRILEGYGTTECAPVLTLNTPTAYKPGSVGQFLPGIEYRIETVAGIENGGILHVRGPNLMLGYHLFDDPEALQPPQSKFGQGWYCTGDVIEVDAEGYVTIKGRIRRFAKIAGEMVSLQVVENIALHVSPRHHHAATLQADRERGEIIVLFTSDPQLKCHMLAHAARRTGHAALAVPRRIIHVEELPFLGSGKVDYLTLKDLARAIPEGVTV